MTTNSLALFLGLGLMISARAKTIIRTATQTKEMHGVVGYMSQQFTLHGDLTRPGTSAFMGASAAFRARNCGCGRPKSSKWPDWKAVPTR